MPLTLREIREAAALLDGAVVRTPCNHSRTLSQIAGAEVFLKFENLQFTASFKDRGALVKLLSIAPDERRAGVIAMSAGNHAQAVAYHAGRLGVPAVIVMPRHTPNVKIERTRALGAEVVLEGEGLVEARAFAEKLAAERGLHFVHPYDDERVIAGQGTVALEMLEQVPDLDVLVVPVGGGGLVAGCAVAARALRPQLEIVGVEAARFPAMRQALDGAPIDCGTMTIAEGIAVKEPGRLTLPIVRDCVSEILLVDEIEIEAAVLLLLEVEKTVVEGAGAVGLAAVLRNRERFAGRRVGLILSGGNLDLLALSSIIQRGLVRSRRMARLRIELPDVPGALADVSRILGDAHGNILEIHHQRAFTDLSLRQAEVVIVLQALGPAHVREIVDTLERAGFPAHVLDAPPVVPVAPADAAPAITGDDTARSRAR